MKTTTDMISFLRPLGRLSFVLLLATILFQKADAQSNDDFCKYQADTPWKTYFDWIAPTQPSSNKLYITFMRYTVNNLNLSANDLAANIFNLDAFGTATYWKYFGVNGLSCFHLTFFEVYDPLTGLSFFKEISGNFAVISGSRSGKIVMDRQTYLYSGVKSIDTFLFKKEGGGEWLVVYFKKTVDQ